MSSFTSARAVRRMSVFAAQEAPEDVVGFGVFALYEMKPERFEGGLRGMLWVNRDGSVSSIDATGAEDGLYVMWEDVDHGAVVEEIREKALAKAKRDHKASLKDWRRCTCRPARTPRTARHAPANTSGPPGPDPAHGPGQAPRRPSAF